MYGRASVVGGLLCQAPACPAPGRVRLHGSRSFVIFDADVCDEAASEGARRSALPLESVASANTRDAGTALLLARR